MLIKQHLRFIKYSAGVRASAAESLPLLLTSAQVKGEDHVKDIWDYIAPNLLQAIADEPVSDTQSVEMEALARVGLSFN